MVVSEGRVVACEWEPTRPGGDDRCERFLTTETSPIDDLFSRSPRYPPEFTTVTYHEKWQFPTHVEYDDPGSIDEEYVVSVTRFIDTSR